MRGWLVPVVATLVSACATSGAPRSVQIAQPASADDVRRAIKLALAGRHWAVEKEAPGLIHAGLTRPDMEGDTGVIALKYTAESVTITPLGVRHAGTDLNHFDSTVLGDGIGKTQMDRWVANLEKDIPVHLERERIRSEPPVSSTQP